MFPAPERPRLPTESYGRYAQEDRLDEAPAWRQPCGQSRPTSDNVAFESAAWAFEADIVKTPCGPRRPNQHPLRHGARAPASFRGCGTGYRHVPGQGNHWFTWVSGRSPRRPTKTAEPGTPNTANGGCVAYEDDDQERRRWPGAAQSPRIQLANTVRIGAAATGGGLPSGYLLARQSDDGRHDAVAMGTVWERIRVDLYPDANVVKIASSPSSPQRERPVDDARQLTHLTSGNMLVGGSGIEPVTSTVSTKINKVSHQRKHNSSRSDRSVESRWMRFSAVGCIYCRLPICSHVLLPSSSCNRRSSIDIDRLATRRHDHLDESCVRVPTCRLSCVDEVLGTRTVRQEDRTCCCDWLTSA
ncbi:hypothetical protein EV192_1021020 [Actinocrispum wychmicini]|uniref:Uncharacterized protein n=1 Tax=Actinocrispum wychmicini TaxID=1213861 RepID=A0A4V2S889_9PSEU|nr:hypothetical protein EV192_1021020 [Actinocrispum wychmicini]